MAATQPQAQQVLNGLAWHKDALAFVRGLDKKLRRQIVKRANDLLTDPMPSGAKMIHGRTDGHLPVYRVRQGDHRILYSVGAGPEVTILDVGDRKDVYRE